MKNRIICIIVLIFLVSLTTISAVTIDLGPNIRLLDGQERAVNLEDVDEEQQLVFEVTFINGNNYWVCSKHWSTTLSITKDGEDKVRSLSWSNNYNDNKEDCIAPQEELRVWLFFEEYNELDEEKRIGDWHVNPTIFLGNNPNSYSSKDLTKASRIEVKKQGNPFDFYVRKDEVSTNPTLNDWKKKFEWFWDNIIFWIGGGILIIIGLIVWLAKAFK